MNEDEKIKQLIHDLTMESIELEVDYNNGLEYINHVNKIIRMVKQLPHTIAIEQGEQHCSNCMCERICKCKKHKVIVEQGFWYPAQSTADIHWPIGEYHNPDRCYVMVEQDIL